MLPAASATPVAQEGGAALVPPAPPAPPAAVLPVDAAAAAAPAPATAAPPAPTPSPTPAHKVFDTLPTAPTPRQTAPPQPAAGQGMEAADTRPVLATLEALNEGVTKGSRISLRTPLAHVGRGAHNDVRLGDESVSETHAKLQRREDGWYLVDMDSTNGSYIGGTRVLGERRIDGSPDLRFGGVKMRFVPAGAPPAEADAKGTRAIAAVDRKSMAARPAPAPAPAADGGTGVPAWVWILAALVVAAAAFFMLKGPA